MDISNLGSGFEQVVDDAIGELQPVPDSGIAVAVIKNGQVQFARGYGFRDRAARAKVDSDTCFAIGSATKAFTSLAILMHVEENKLDLSVPIKQYLADFNMRDPQAAAQMTLQDILCHRTGLPRHDALWYLGPFTRSQLFYRLPYLKGLPGAFRQAFQYNNLMYTVAGNLLDNLFGTSWEDVVQSRILDPVGMADSNFKLSDLTGRHNHAKGYVKGQELPLKDVTNIGPAGEINSTALDMAKWLQLFLNKGVTSTGAAIISPASLDKMFTGLIDAGNGVRYGLGWFVHQIDGKRLIFHEGDTDGNSTHVSLLPDVGLGLAVLTNQHCTFDLVDKWPDKLVARIYEYLLTGLASKTLNLPPRAVRPASAKAVDEPAAAPSIAEAPAAAPPAPLAAPSLSAFAGMYSDPGYGDVSVSLAGSKLSFSYYNRSWPMTRVTSLAFEFVLHAFATEFRSSVIFREDGNGKVIGLVLRFAQIAMPIDFAKR